MRVGLVCPFSLDVPGGVQAHVMELAAELMRRGHEVRVLAPASQTLALPPWITSSGDSVPIPYNGSVARLNFGAVVARRARRWLEAGDFDLIHIHEPITPSVGMLVKSFPRACRAGAGYCLPDPPRPSPTAPAVRRSPGRASAQGVPSPSAPGHRYRTCCNSRVGGGIWHSSSRLAL